MLGRVVRLVLMITLTLKTSFLLNFKPSVLCLFFNRNIMNIEKIVLLIDDDEDDRDMLQQALHSIDGEHSIVEANDGKDGLQQLQSLKATNSLPCLIVMDINMPKLDGKQAFMAI